jgi:uncharacterized coiled-coil protein SlyX
VTELKQETLQKIADVAGKLLYEVERLRRDVARLHGRIQNFEGEPPLSNPPPYVEPRFMTLQDALDALADARRGIAGAEQQLAKMSNKLDQIASQSISREEMRPWLKGSK